MSSSIKQKLILSAIECIEKDGFQKATIRNIAKAAGTNVAAVNYHFGSKEKFFEIVMNATLDESFINNIEDYAGIWKTQPEVALENFLKDTLAGSITYKNLTKAHFSEAFNNNNYNTSSVKRTNTFLSEFHDLIKNALSSQDELLSKIALVQIFSSLFMISLMPDFFYDFLNIDLKKIENQQVFVETLLENFVKK